MMVETNEPTSVLLSTGEIARRLGRSVSSVKQLVASGCIPPAIVITGSGKRAWRQEDFPKIETAIKERRRKVRTARTAATQETMTA